MENGANLEDVNKLGMTPLMVAVKAKRNENVKYIVETIVKKRKDAGVIEEFSNKLGETSNVNSPNVRIAENRVQINKAKLSF